jgi:hypothetical protein
MLHDTTLLRREQLAAALAEAGHSIAVRTLASLGSKGPPVARRSGQTPFFRWSEALAWARHRSANRKRAGRPKGAGAHG